MRREVTAAFVRVLRDKGVEVPSATIALSQRRIREAKYFQIVDVRAHDRKAYDDAKPRIRRRNDLLAPMQQIVMDVKVVDCVVRRPDGSAAWPRMVTFMDTGTQRLFCRFFLLQPTEGIRQEHVAHAFLDMIADEEWGFPQQLYRDNGPEFFIMDMIRSALDHLRTDGVPTIINARPYSAASKPIESKFSVLDRFVFSQMSGWAGGDRLRKKTAAVGNLPNPFAGTFEQFVTEAIERIRILEAEPIGSGPFAGKTPNEIYAQRVASGWRPLLVSTNRVDAAFCGRETRRVSRGRLRIGGSDYRHPSLTNGRTLTVALPWRRSSSPLALVPELGWVTLLEDVMFVPTDPAGARESRRRQREHDAAVSRLKVQAGSIDLATNRREQVAALSGRPNVEPTFDVDILPNQAELATALPKMLAPEQNQAAEQRLKRQSLTDDLERYIASQKR